MSARTVHRADAGAFTRTEAGRAAGAIVRRLRERGHQAFLAGGCVRDACLGIEPHDFDVATSARPEEVHAAFGKVIDTGIRFGTVTVVDGDSATQVTTFRTESAYGDRRHPSQLRFGASLEEDAARRDFTMNALFADPVSDEVIDCVGGLDDLRARRLRAVGDPGERFDEDALRLLRLVRFAARFGAAIDAETERAARARPHRLRGLSAERVREELSRMLAEDDPAGALRRLDAYAFLDVILPEVAAARGVPQPPEYHPEGDVLVHTIDVVARLDRRTPALSLAALLHDVGKVTTLTWSDRIRFHGHEFVSCEMAERRMRALAFPNAVIAGAIDLIAEHIRFGSFLAWRRAKQLRFLGKSNVREHLALHRAERLSASADLAVYDAASEALARMEASPPPVEPVLRGDDLRALGYAPGPRFRTILEALRDEQLEGRIEGRDGALEFLRRKFPL